MKIIPPSLVRLRIKPAHGWFPTLFLPLFLVWLLVLVLLVLASPLLVLAALVLFAIDADAVRRWLAFLGGIYRVICELRGTLVDVRGPHSHVLISVL